MSAIKLYTGRISYRGKDKLDITVWKAKTPAGQLLKPSWEIVNGHKYDGLSDEAYTEAYFEMVNKRYLGNVHHQQILVNLLKQDSLTLCCFCNARKFCHRHLAMYIMIEIAERRNIPYVFMGER